MSEKDYTKDSKKWPKTPGKDWQIAKNLGKVNSPNQENGVRK